MHGHSSLLSNLWCTASKLEAPRIYTEHLSMILRTRIRLKRMSAQKNDCSPFLPNGEDATPAFPIEPAFPIAPSSHSHTA